MHAYPALHSVNTKVGLHLRHEARVSFLGLLHAGSHYTLPQFRFPSSVKMHVGIIQQHRLCTLFPACFWHCIITYVNKVS